MSAEQIAEVIRAHQPTTGMSVASGVTCRCGYWNGDERAGVDRLPGYQGLQWHQAQALSAAGFGLVADAKAEALGEAAERFKQRSDTYHNTMQEMTASKEYGLEDIVRYGAYSAEANTTATWLRTQAAKTRATS
ncbi:hypothetical protein [Pseudarthrobacter sp. BRE9]|uniref:hypothetical protein n=1 Tax=Pseudarthrobacter sp. BRE9 TaxID=2962582 RepID=UPI002880DECA|nr:hypothetical protein [Pseudarthrobacter sp. BRE9]MDT0171048.1 hypothetical protein [Pseudarthrobacter sp. BRE9]